MSANGLRCGVRIQLPPKLKEALDASDGAVERGEILLPTQSSTGLPGISAAAGSGQSTDDKTTRYVLLVASKMATAAIS
jgi:hypothetical protein